MRIFLMDNDEKYLNAVKNMLIANGHSVVTEADIDKCDADVLAGKGYEIALIDRRAKDDNDPNDDSGEKLAAGLGAKGVTTILVSIVPGDVKVFEYLRSQQLIGVVNKDMVDGVKLLECLKQYERVKRFPNGFAEFTMTNAAGGACFPPKDWCAKLGTTELELEMLFRELVSPCASQVTLGSMSLGQSSAILAEAFVSSGDGVFDERLAIKCGKKDLILGEELSYDRHIGPLPDGVAAQLRWRAETQNLAAVAYSWVGNSIENGEELGKGLSAKYDAYHWHRRHAVIQRLFSVSLHLWYEAYRKYPPILRLNPPERLIDYYTGVRGMWKSPLLNLADWQPDAIATGNPKLSVKPNDAIWTFDGHFLKNPLKWLTNGGNGAMLSFSQQAPIHGDLHVRNIFMLPDNSPRLIDFGDTSLGHVFRDFAALEASVRLTCHKVTDLKLLQSVEDIVCEAKGLGDHLDYRGLPDDLGEVVKATMEIRRAALDAVGTRHAGPVFQEYLFAVIIRLLRYGGGIADDTDKTGPRFESLLWQALYGAAKAASIA